MGKSIVFETYKDHRMAMCFAPLVLMFDQIVIKDKGVVNNELLEVAKTLIYAVAGINGISYFTNKVGEYDDRV